MRVAEGEETGQLQQECWERSGRWSLVQMGSDTKQGFVQKFSCFLFLGREHLYLATFFLMNEFQIHFNIYDKIKTEI